VRLVDAFDFLIQTLEIGRFIKRGAEHV
jgi:hypothetical protein